MYTLTKLEAPLIQETIDKIGNSISLNHTHVLIDKIRDSSEQRIHV